MNELVGRRFNNAQTFVDEVGEDRFLHGGVQVHVGSCSRV